MEITLTPHAAKTLLEAVVSRTRVVRTGPASVELEQIANELRTKLKQALRRVEPPDAVVPAEGKAAGYKSQSEVG